MYRPIKLFAFIFILFVHLNSCGVLMRAKAKKYVTIAKGAIPPNFGADNSGILFLTHQNSYNRYLKRNIRKAYGGPHGFMGPEELEEKGAGTYRYIFDYGYRTGQRFSPNTVVHGAGGGLSTTRVKQFFITDTKTDSSYILKVTSGYWSKLQRFYLKKLEEERIRNYRP